MVAVSVIVIAEVKDLDGNGVYFCYLCREAAEVVSRVVNEQLQQARTNDETIHGDVAKRSEVEVTSDVLLYSFCSFPVVCELFHINFYLLRCKSQYFNRLEKAMQRLPKHDRALGLVVVNTLAPARIFPDNIFLSRE